jgi:hypothetical protein
MLSEFCLFAECKLVRDSFEPKFYSDDLWRFVESDKAYVKQIQRKLEWVRTNLSAVCSAMSSEHNGNVEIAPDFVAGSILTFFPTMASCFIPTIPCVSITELMMDYEALGRYPYDTGIYRAS